MVSYNTVFKSWQIFIKLVKLCKPNLMKDIYFGDCILSLANNFFKVIYLGTPKHMSLVLKFVLIVYKCFYFFRLA